MKTTFNRQLFAIATVLSLVVLTAATYKFTQIVERLSHLESAVDDIAGTADDHSSEIDSLRSDVDDIQSER